MFQILFLVSFLLGTFISFRIVLGLLKVRENVNRRSAFLSVLFLITQVFSSLVVYFSGMVEPASAVITIIVFTLVLRRFLTLKLWQAILIPIGVSIVSGVILAILLMSTVGLWSGTRL